MCKLEAQNHNQLWPCASYPQGVGGRVGRGSFPRGWVPRVGASADSLSTCENFSAMSCHIALGGSEKQLNIIYESLIGVFCRT
jgi:hypothetical protein